LLEDLLELDSQSCSGPPRLTRSQLEGGDGPATWENGRAGDDIEVL
jgi:hypothetical protein